MIEIDPEKHAQPKFDLEMQKRVRTTRADLDNYTSADVCPSCEAINTGNHATEKQHTEWCRIRRVYGKWEQAGDPEWQRLSQQLG